MGRSKRFLTRLLVRQTVQRSQRIIIVSQHTASDAVRLLNADPQKLRVIPHGVEERFFQPGAPGEAEMLRTRYGLNAPYILFVGERRPHKNLPGLIQSFAHFQRLTPATYQLVIAGKCYGDYQAPEKLVEHLRLETQVRFIDALPDADLPALIRNAAACALLSLYEGFGLPLLEAMACGTPVVASNLTSLPEVAGEAALLVAPDNPLQAAEALQQAAGDGPVRSELIQRGLARAHLFTWQRCAQMTSQVYREVVNE
jgi:glycosyltransferase involved in cell wall biosynthesis